MNQQIQQFLNKHFPDLSNANQLKIDFMDEDEFHEWLHQRLLLFSINKDVQTCVTAIHFWCIKGYESGIDIIHQLLIILACIQLRKNPTMVDEIITFIQDSDEKQRLMKQLEESQQNQINLKVEEQSPKMLKAKTDSQEGNFFTNIVALLKCKDKKQK